MSAMKKLLVLVFSTALALACMPSIAVAGSPPVSLDSPSKTIVSGTTYAIGNAGELANLAAIVNGTGGAAAQNCDGATFVLTGDIVLPGPWTPIGMEVKPFFGTFDGGGYEISGLNVSGGFQYAGLFGFISGSSIIKNTGVSGSVSSSLPESHVGGIVGANFDGIVYNCRTSGVVSATGMQAYVGGITGDNFTSGIVRSCYNLSGVTAWGSQSYVGGIAGRNDFATIENCFNSGGVAGASYCYTGGIAAHCFAGPVRNCYNVGTVAGGTYCGYIIGYNSTTVPTNCYWLDMGGTPMGSGSTPGIDFVSFTAAGGGTLTSAVTVPG
ncbi:MAG: hypothetical protein HGA54_05115, partial [Actinobacteria bacterium]|nr:hypothetical protein [Actinomycetota bacterium]